MAKRIVGEKIAIDYAGVQRFFDERSARDGLRSRYSYVLFQDDNPTLAEERDAAEKLRIGPALAGGGNALDIGCGIGRWGEYFLIRGVRYTGIDAGSQMVARGRENLAALKATAPFELYVGLAQDTVQVLRGHGADGKYDVILVNGVLMYLNDDDLESTFAAVNALADEHAVLYFKESMGLERRLTLDEIHSEALHQDYSAIYRSVSEYEELFRNAFGGTFALVDRGPLFDDSMRNRCETLDYYFLYRR